MAAGGLARAQVDAKSDKSLSGTIPQLVHYSTVKGVGRIFF